MKAIILAAGVGNRMRPVTLNIHKTLLPIGDMTILERIIKSLLDKGVRDLLIVTGYRSDDVRAHVSEKFPGVDVAYVHNPYYETTNNIYSLWLAVAQVPDGVDVLLIESDLVYQPEILDQILNSSYDNVALVDKFSTGMDGTVVTVDGGRVTSVIPPHLQGKDFDFSDKYKTLNIYKFSAAFLSGVFRGLLDYYVKVFDKNSYYELVLGILIYSQKENIHAEVVGRGSWAEIDDPNDLRIAEYQFLPSKRYAVLESSFGGYWQYPFLDFAYIRNVYFPNDSMIAEMRSLLPRLLDSYCSSQQILDNKLAFFLNCTQGRAVLLNGVSQIYPIFERAFAGKRVLLPSPTFGEYAARFSTASFYRDIPGYSLADVEALVRGHDVVVIVNPNNPTGTDVPSTGIYELAGKNPDKLFIVDESFIDFSDHTSLLPLLEKDPLTNLVVIKSLSKCLGIPGLRIGFSYSCDPAFNAMIKGSIPVWNMNSLAEFFLELILKHRTSLVRSYSQSRKDRGLFFKQLKTVPIINQVYPGGGNFLLVRLTSDPALKHIGSILLEDHGIYVKDVSKKFPDGRIYFRFAVRKPEDNTLLVETLKQFI